MSIKTYKYSLLWAMFILLLSVLPASLFPQTDAQRLFPHADKVVHFIFYTILLFILIHESLSNRPAAISPNKFLLLILLGTIYGFLMELIQLSPLTQRSFSIADVLANSLGCIAGACLGIKKRKFKLRKNEH